MCPRTLVHISALSIISRLSFAFHLTASYFGGHFFRALDQHRPSEPLRILEIGSEAVNGGLRDYARGHWNYTGVDLHPGKGVDVILKNPYKYPFVDGQFDAVVSSTAFEHVDFFWSTFVEMVRVTASDGFIYILAPSNMRDHGKWIPPDSWRFLKDAGKSMARWGVHNGYKNLRLLQTFVAKPVNYQSHEDMVMTFTRGLDSFQIPESPPNLFADAFGMVLLWHRCWQSLPYHERTQYFESSVNREPEPINFPCACCRFYEITKYVNGAKDAAARRGDTPTWEECWDAGRTPHECCPRMHTDGWEGSCLQFTKLLGKVD